MKDYKYLVRGILIATLGKVRAVEHIEWVAQGNTAATHVSKPKPIKQCRFCGQVVKPQEHQIV